MCEFIVRFSTKNEKTFDKSSVALLTALLVFARPFWLQKTVTVQIDAQEQNSNAESLDRNVALETEALVLLRFNLHQQTHVKYIVRKMPVQHC